MNMTEQKARATYEALINETNDKDIIKFLYFVNSSFIIIYYLL